MTWGQGHTKVLTRIQGEVTGIGVRWTTIKDQLNGGLKENNAWPEMTKPSLKVVQRVITKHKLLVDC